MRANIWLYLFAVVAVVLVWNIGAKVGDANRLFARVSDYFTRHWVTLLVVLVLMFTHRRLLKPPWFPRIALLAFVFVYACYKPVNSMKQANFVWAPLSDKHWTELSKRKGLVSSFTLQGEVAWNTGRKNIPAPEWPMHIYSWRFNHKLEVEDVYLENSDALVYQGAFGWAAPGFEGYGRLQRWRTLPGYEVAYHDEAMRGYPRYKVKPLFKATTVFKLVDRAAIDALRKSPDRIELGDPANVIYTAHGWGEYFDLAGRKAVAATDATSGRYARADEGPWESSSITFFLDERQPRSVVLDVYATHATKVHFYWNLDLYEYDRAKDRAQHMIGTFDAPAEGWHKVELQVPPKLLRRGLNKLGFRVARMQSTVMCPERMTDDACRSEIPAREHKPDEPDGGEGSVKIVRAAGLTDPVISWISLLAGTLEFRY